MENLETMKVMKVSEKGINLIKRFEGLILKPYLCPAKIPTIGYGNTFYEDGTKVTMNDKPITAEMAEKLLKITVNNFALKVQEIIKVTLLQHQFDAIVSFAYNVGIGNLKKSTLLKKINNSEFKEAIFEFGKWNKAGGKVLKGLTTRREAERQMFIGL